MRTRHPRSRPLATVLLLASFAAVHGACPSLDDIPLGECGNGVVEADIGEDCDAPPEAPTTRTPGKSYCARANETYGCHYVWDESTCCPENFGRGLDGRCRQPSGAFEDTLLRIDEPVIGLGNSDVDGDGYRDLAIRYVSREIELRFLGPDADPTPVRDVRPSAADSRTSFGYLNSPFDPTADRCGRATAFPSGAVFIPSDVGVRVLVGGPDGLLPKAFPAFDTSLASLPVALPAAMCGSLGLTGVLPQQMSCPGALAELGDAVALVSVDISLALDGSTEQGQDVRALFPGIGLSDLGAIRRRISMPAWPGCHGMALDFGDDAGSFASSIVVLGMCADGLFAVEELARVPIPDGGRAFVLDSDRDGDDDILVGSEVDTSVYLGDGAGRFGDDDGEPSYVLPAVLGRVPLAVGHLDEDVSPDFILASLVADGDCPSLAPSGSGGGGAGGEGPGGDGGSAGGLSGAGGALDGSGGGVADPFACAYPWLGSFVSKGVFLEVVVADVNGDGRGDVVGSMFAEESRDFSVGVLLSGVDGVYTLDQRPTAVEARSFAAGDFDGDGIEDVAFVLPSLQSVGVDEVSCTATDGLSILYGARGLPDEARTVAQVAGIRGIATGLILGDILDLDGIHDIGLTRRCRDEERGELRQEATILFGNGSRGVDSPYELEGGIEQRRFLFATGRVRGGDQHPDLVALGEREPMSDDDPGGLGLWAVRSFGDSELPPNRVPPTSPDPNAERFLGAKDTGLDGPTLAHALAVGDLDCGPEQDATACATDEIVVFETNGTSTHADAVDEPRVTIFAGSTADAPPEFRVTSGPCPELPGSLAFMEEIESLDLELDLDVPPWFHFASIIDVDHDGYRDVVGWWVGLDPLDFTTILAGGAFVFWNGSEGFAGTCPSPIEAPEGQYVTSVHPYDAGDGEPWLAFSTREGVHLAQVFERDLGACAAGQGDRCIAVTDVAPVNDFTFIDVDHDGLDDLVVAQRDGLVAVRQRSLDEVVVERSSTERDESEED